MQDYATYEYTPNGKQKTVIDANGNKALLCWDGHDRQRRWVFPSKTVVGSASSDCVSSAGDYEQYGYDTIGNRVSLRKRDATTISYGYDNLNRVTTKGVPASASGAPGYTVYTGYDFAGLRTYARFGSASGLGITNEYDNLGRLKPTTNSTGGTSRTLTYFHDLEGNRIRITHPDGIKFGYAYDGLSRLRLVHDQSPFTSSDDFVTSKIYDPQGTVGQWLWGGGGAMFASARFFDGIGRQTYLGYDLPGTSNDLGYNIAYNPASQVTSQTRSNPAYAWSGGVPVNRNYAVNGQNQYQTAGPATFTYDANGNLVGDGTTNYVFDIENRLVSAAAAATGATTASLVYDPLGRLWQTSGGSAGVTQFLHDGDELVAEYNGSGTLLRRYVHGDLPDDPLAVYEGGALGSANRAYLQTDVQGNVVALINGNGSGRNVNSYDEYGIPGATNAGRFQYTGQAWIPELGMYYYKARIYSPTLGRFVQTDPIGYEGGINLYAYADNDPVNLDDPDGTCPSCIGFGIGAAIEGVNQASNSRDRAAWRAGWNSLRQGKFRQAFQQTRSQLARLGVAGTTGAVGGIGVAKVTTSVATAGVKKAATAGVGSAEAAANKAGSNVVSGKRAGDGVAGAAVAGGAGAHVAGAVGRKVQDKIFATGVARIGPGRTPGSQALARHDARVASARAGNFASGTTTLGAGGAQVTRERQR